MYLNSTIVDSGNTLVLLLSNLLNVSSMDLKFCFSLYILRKSLAPISNVRMVTFETIVYIKNKKVNVRSLIA